MSGTSSKFESCIEDFERTVKVQCLDALQTYKEININITRGVGLGVKSVNEWHADIECVARFSHDEKNLPTKVFLMTFIDRDADPNDYEMIGYQGKQSEVMEDQSPILQYDSYLCHKKSHIEFKKKK